MSAPPAEPGSTEERLAAATEAQDWQEVQRLAKALEREKHGEPVLFHHWQPGACCM